MNKPFVFMLVLLLAFSVSPASASARQSDQRSIPVGIEYIDAQVEIFATHLNIYQAGYLAEHGQYFQALQSHSYAPDTLEPPDSLASHPTYQDEPLGVLWTAAALPYELAWSFNVGTYDGPNGKGWVLNVVTMLNNHTYACSINYGPEAYRNQDWYEVLPEEY